MNFSSLKINLNSLKYCFTNRYLWKVSILFKRERRETGTGNAEPQLGIDGSYAKKYLTLSYGCSQKMTVWLLFVAFHGYKVPFQVQCRAGARRSQYTSFCFFYPLLALLTPVLDKEFCIFRAKNKHLVWIQVRLLRVYAKK